MARAKAARPAKAEPAKAAKPTKAKPAKATEPAKATPAKAKPTTPAKATKPAQVDAPPSGLPSWAGKPPDAAGLLPIPDAKKKALAAALGPLDRAFGIVRKVGMAAFAGRAGVWGLGRQVSVDEGRGGDLARLLEVLDREQLPLLGLELWYPAQMGRGTSSALAAIVEAGLRTAAARHLERLSLVTNVELDPALAGSLASAVGGMKGLRELDLRGRGGVVTDVVRAGPGLEALTLVSVTSGPAELAALARAPQLAALRALSLQHVEAEAGAIAELVSSMSGLERLELSRGLLLPADFSFVASLARLRELQLRFADEKTVDAIAGAAFVPQLRRLALSDTKIDHATAKRLAARGLPGLETLSLKHCEVSEPALRVLVDAAPALTTLGIPSTTRPQTWAKRGRTVL